MRHTLLHILLWMPAILWGNAAAPHFSFPGGHSTLLYSQDSLLVRSIRLRHERILIHVYKQHAVVYGRYVFAKGDAQPMSLTLGYPVFDPLEPDIKQGHGMYDSYPDRPTHLQVRVNGQLMDTSLIHTPEGHNADTRSSIRQWYIWPARFETDSLVCEVFFVVNTDQAMFRHGYSKQKDRGFSYILSSGAVWQRPIDQGEVYIKLCDGLDLSDLKGMHPEGFYFSVDKQWLRWQFSHLKPDWTHNVLVRYAARGGKSTFPAAQPEGAYLTLSNDLPHIPRAGWRKLDESITRNLREVTPSVAGRMVETGFVLFIYAPVWVPTLLILLVAWWWYKRKRRNR
jgi:hypothetical protein